MRTVERHGACVIVRRRQPATVIVSMSYYATLVLRWLSSPDRARTVDGELGGNTMTLIEALERYTLGPEGFYSGVLGDFRPKA